jgi:phosphatidylserine/phosphatidylglycerophosphate/cardiolipin synthase-like enzyme
MSPAARGLDGGWCRLRMAAMACGALIALLLAGCASLPDPPDLPPSRFRVAPADAPLARLAQDAQVPADRSGFRSLLVSTIALSTRLALIDQARVGLDVQTYLLGNDATGHQLLRALRDAARRGVRVRLLLDDFYTTGLTDLLLGLAATPNVEVRLYNPFPAGRDSLLLRMVSMAGDFSQLNRRMHNKLFVADGRAAIIGGRNLADAYFMRSEEGNFFDFELLCVGAVVPELDRHFDRFWNSRFARPLQALADNGLDSPQRQASFDVLTRAVASARPARIDARLAAFTALANQPLVLGDARVFADSPDKTAGTAHSDRLMPLLQLLDDARERVVIVSPYFLPSDAGLRRMQEASARGVTVQVLTNSLLDSDEPLVSMAYGRRRLTLLQSGVQLFELSSAQVKHEDMLRQSLGNSVARLHAKLGFIDDRLLLIGSMNIDPRSAGTNTELALAIDSPDLIRVVLGQFQPTSTGSVLEVRLATDGQALEWVGRDSRGGERLSAEPTPPWWEQFKLWMLSLVVPDDLL